MCAYFRCALANGLDLQPGHLEPVPIGISRLHCVQVLKLIAHSPFKINAKHLLCLAFAVINLPPRKKGPP